MKKISILLSILSLLILTAPAWAERLPVYDPLLPNSKTYNTPGPTVTKVDRKYGYYVDGRNQIPAYQRISPPHPENIPNESHPARTVENFESYYDRNIKGERRPEYMTPIVPNYNKFYSNRRAYPYTRDEYLNVWCDGTIDYEKGTCTTEKYKIFFIKARDWAFAVTAYPFKTLKAKKDGKKYVIFVMVDDLGLDAVQMSDMKYFANTFGISILFGTIDSFIPIDWVH